MKKRSAPSQPLLAALFFAGICRITGQAAYAALLTALLLLAAFVVENHSPL